MKFLLFLHLCVLLFFIRLVDSVLPQLPIFPSNEMLTKARNEFTYRNMCMDSSKLIPCHVWITGRELSRKNAPPHVKALINRNKDWYFHLFDDEKIKEFMKRVFHGTAIAWAYEHISHPLGASRADIWRLAVLWTHGGVYIDLDSDIRTPLSQVIYPNDSMILSTEGNPLGRCFKPSYHLNISVTHTIAEWYQNKSILQWMIISQPGHMFIQRALENIVELVQLEYQKKSVVEYESNESTAMLVFCCTGPVLFSSSVLEVINEKHTNVTYRYIGKDFELYGGLYKAVGYKDILNGERYEKLMKKGMSFLKKYEE